MGGSAVHATVQVQRLSNKEKAMHRILSLPILFDIIFFCACKPTKVHPSGTFTGKVIGDICSQYTIQLVSGDMDPARYVKTWKNEQTDTTYHNVFSLSNFCYFDQQNLHRGDTFQLSLIKDSAQQTCVVCFAYSPTPPIKNTIRVVSAAK